MSEAGDDRLAPVTMAAAQALFDAMDGCRHLFLPECLITVVVRTPSDPEGDMIVTRDTIDELMELLVRRKANSLTATVWSKEPAESVDGG